MARRHRVIIGLLAVCLCTIGAMIILPLGTRAIYVGMYQSDIDKHPDLVRVYWKSPDIEPILSRQPKIDKWVVIGGGGDSHPRTASRISFWRGGGIQFVCWYHEETPVRYLWLQEANEPRKKFTPPPLPDGITMRDLPKWLTRSVPHLTTAGEAELFEINRENNRYRISLSHGAQVSHNPRTVYFYMESRLLEGQERVGWLWFYWETDAHGWIIQRGVMNSP